MAGPWPRWLLGVCSRDSFSRACTWAAHCTPKPWHVGCFCYDIALCQFKCSHTQTLLCFVPFPTVLWGLGLVRHLQSAAGWFSAGDVHNATAQLQLEHIHGWSHMLLVTHAHSFSFLLGIIHSFSSMQLSILSPHVAADSKLMRLLLFYFYFYRQPADARKGCLLTLITTLLIALGRLL